MAYNIKNPKPKFTTGEVISSEGVRPRLSFSNHVTIFISKGDNPVSYVLSWVWTAARATLIGLILLSVLYTGIGGTLLFYTSTGDGFFNTLVARNTFIGGIPESGRNIISSTTEDAPDPHDYITKSINAWTGVTNPVVSKVVAVSGESIFIQNRGKVSLSDGTPVPYPLGEGVIPIIENNTIYTLDGEYLTVCLDGECNKGELILVPHGKVFGEVKNFEEGEK